ncbi:MAG: FHA domain-containing protein [Myxococcota bacterium]
MAIADAPAGNRRIRVLNGPLRDATFDPSVRLTIGRDIDCDIQIVHDGVSRQHACIMTDIDGNHVLIDLESTNGTFVEQRRVNRTVLEVGTIFEVMRYRMVYEEEVRALEPLEEGAVVATTGDGPPAHRTTIAYSAFQGSQEAASGVSEPGRSSASADHPGRVQYHGDVIGDIAEYRALRTRVLRGEPQSSTQGASFRDLEQRMRPGGAAFPTAGGIRTYHRFSCRIDGSLRMFTGEEHAIDVVEIGVDGAEIEVGAHSIMVDTLVWLAVERNRGGGTHTLVFPARVIWVRGGNLGVSFAGAPGWSPRGQKRHEPIAQRTNQEMRPYGSPHESGSRRLHLMKTEVEYPTHVIDEEELPGEPR